MSEKYNGWVNYETWLMGLVLSNDQSLYNSVLSLLEANDELDEYDKACVLKEWVEDTFYVEEYSIYRVDCESWSLRDFAEVEFLEIVQSFGEK